MALIVVVIVLLGCLPLGYTYPAGAPDKACKDMFPGHNFDSQMSSSPYTIQAIPNKYFRGGNVTVVIWSQKGNGFKGFFLQAHKADCNISEFGVPVGRFSTLTEDHEVNLRSCPGQYKNNGVTHNSNIMKRSKTFTWNNPAGGDVFFQATILQDFKTFWSGLQTDVVRDTTMMDIGKVYRHCPARKRVDEMPHVSSATSVFSCNTLIYSAVLLFSRL